MNQEEEKASELSLDESTMPEDTIAPKKQRSRIWDFVEIICFFAFAVFCMYFVPRNVLQRTIVKGNSMQNTLQTKENLLVEKVSYHFKDPNRFDVIVFYPHGRAQGDYYIKRVIGLPGETVQIKPPYIYINGKKLKENYGKDPIVNAGIAAKPLKLKKNEFFVMGDNRRISEDSRYEEVGPVTRDKIDGRALVRIYPFKKFGDFDKMHESK